MLPFSLSKNIVQSLKLHYNDHDVIYHDLPECLKYVQKAAASFVLDRYQGI